MHFVTSKVTRGVVHTLEGTPAGAETYLNFSPCDTLDFSVIDFIIGSRPFWTFAPFRAVGTKCHNDRDLRSEPAVVALNILC